MRTSASRTGAGATPMFADSSSAGPGEVAGAAGAAGAAEAAVAAVAAVAAGAAGAAGSAGVSPGGGLLAGELMVLHGFDSNGRYRPGTVRGIVTELEGKEPPRSQMKAILPKEWE